MLKKRFSFLKNKYFIIGAAVVVILILYFSLKGGTKTQLESAVATIANVQEKVSVTGKILPIDRSDLSFQVGGTVAKIYVKVGDPVKKGDRIAELNNYDVVASLASAQAKLDDMTRPLRPSELAVEQAKKDSAYESLVGAKSDAVNTFRDSYTKAQGAIVNYADTFFTNAQSANPVIDINTPSFTDQTIIDGERLAAGDALAAWKNEITKVDTTANSPADVLAKANGHITTIKIFMDHLSSLVSNLNPSSSGLAQSRIDQYTATMNSALTLLNQAIAPITAAQTALQQAQLGYTQALSDFQLKNSAYSDEAIRAQRATVDSLAATVAKTQISSPLDGIVTRADPQIGEYVTPGQSGFAVQSDGVYKIEAFVPEADIAKISIGNKAEVTLDAYGSDTIFPATVTLMDPAETVIEGVPTYKVTLNFDQKDSRIRSGMTANTDIMTHEVDGVLSIPTRAIINTDGVKTVRVLNSDGVTFKTVTVTTGLKGSTGTTEITGGLKEGDKVVTYVK